MKTNIEAKEHAIKTIQYEEWLKHTVKYIVEGNPEISDGCLLELVDDKYNDVFFYDNSQYKVKQEGEELVKYFTRMNPKGTSRQDIKEFSNTVLSLKAQVMPFTRKFTGLVSQWNPDKKKFAKNVAKVFFNVSNNEGTLEAVRKFFANLQYNMGNPHFKAQQSLLYLLSKDFGGTGKTYFMEQLVKWANERKLPTCHANVDTAYLGHEFNNSLIGYVSDYNPSRQVFETLNQLVDNVTYISKQKYQNEIELESRITFVMGSNYMVQDGNSRRWSVVDYNIYPYSEWTSRERSEASDVDYMNVFDTLLNTVPAEKFNITQQADKNDRSVQWEEIMFEMREELDDRKKYSSKGLWVLAEPHMTSEQNKYLTLKSLRMYLTELAAKKKIRQYMDSRGNSQYSKLVTYIDSISYDEFEEVNYAVTGTPIAQCKSRWNQIISSLDDNNPVPPAGNDDPDEFIFNSVPVNDTVFDEEIEFMQPAEGNNDVMEEPNIMHAQKYDTLFIRKQGNSIYTQIGNSSEYSQNYLNEQLIKYTSINPSSCETKYKKFNTFEEAQTAQRKLHEVYKPWYIKGGLIKCDNISFKEIATVLDKLNETKYDPKVMSNLQEILMDEHGYEQKYGYIYLVRLEGKNVLKIGYTGNMERRNLKEQFGCDVTVLDTKTTRDMVKHEAKLHVLCTEYKAKTTGYDGHDKLDRNGCSELYDDHQDVINIWNAYWSK